MIAQTLLLLMPKPILQGIWLFLKALLSTLSFPKVGVVKVIEVLSDIVGGMFGIIIGLQFIIEKPRQLNLLQKLINK